jgi:uncharacterized protein (DUF488 family)
MKRQVIYTIGHSNHSIDYFVELLNTFSINSLVDVRTIAASAYNPQYNKEPLSNYLKQKEIQYQHFAEEFGARQTDPTLLDEEGKVDFEKVRKAVSFNKGVEQLLAKIANGETIALMCSESEPFECHRFSMISIALEQQGFEVKHVLKDKSIKSNPDLERQLLKKYDKKLPKPDIFQPDITVKDQLDAAYRLRNKEIAFSPYSKDRNERDD